MYRTTWDGTEAVMVALGKSLLSKGTVGDAMAKVRTVLRSHKCDWMDVRSSGDVAFSALEVIRSCLPFVRRKDEVGRTRLIRKIAVGTETVMKAFNRAYRALWKATKEDMLRNGLRGNRERSEPVVFYLVSSHQKPQPAHKDLQGKILVDRFWRSALKKAGRDDLVDEVGKYVRSQKVATVQWAVGAPHYLIVRPNCRHVLIPIPTSKALGMSLKEVNTEFQHYRTGVKRPITDEQRAQAFASLRAHIVSKLEKTGL